MKKMGTQNNGSREDVVILGGGLAGLSSGYILTKSGANVCVIEAEGSVGGLSKTVEKNGFRFDLGGHRFFTRDQKIESFVREVMGTELMPVQRSSKIYMRGKYFDYPLKPLNAVFGLGIPTTVKILGDYVSQSVARLFQRNEIVSLEDWVVSKFGRTMFNIYFKEYSEKVWGIDCTRICATWVARRIKGLSLAKAVKNGLFKFTGRDLATLTDTFLYPSLGIGRLSERLRAGIETGNRVFTDSRVVSVNHSDRRVESITVENRGARRTVAAAEIVSTIPITRLVSMLKPSPPPEILRTASRLRFRDLVVVALMADRPRLTDQTWIYIPEKKIPFGRIHEPTNWSPAMAPPGKSVLVAEFFSFKNDAVWRMDDADLAALTADQLAGLGFLKHQEILDSVVVRVPNAYPLFEVGYRDNVDVLYDYLNGFLNIYVAGRSGMFEYYNMDAAIRSGMETAETLSSKLCSRHPVVPDLHSCTPPVKVPVCPGQTL